MNTAGSLYIKKKLWRLFPAPAVWIVLCSVRGNGAVCTDGSPHSLNQHYKSLASACAPLSLFVGKRRLAVHVPNLCVCVCVQEGTVYCWHWLDDGPNTWLWWRAGSPAPLATLWRMNINNSKWSQSRLPLRLLPITSGWADIAAAWKATDRQKAEEENCDALLKGTPEVHAISSAGW